jgi:hypothetical protein
MPRRRPRLLKASHLPYVVCRRGWAVALTAILAASLFALACSLIWLMWLGVTKALDWQVFIAVGPLAVIALIGSVIGLDRSFSYKVVIERDGIIIDGLLLRYAFRWQEITSFDARHNHRLPGYYASFKVDGSNHPRLHWSSLWFGFYDIPPLMQFGGKELTALLRHAKRRAEAGWP